MNSKTHQRIGLIVCGCGPEISEKLNIDELIKEAGSEQDVVVAQSHALLCSPEGKQFLKDLIQDHRLSRIVIAGCSPKEHEHTFRKTVQEAGLNPFLLEIVNIREQCAWVSKDKPTATSKAKSLIRGGIKRVRHHKEIKHEAVDVNADVLVIGSGVAGMAAALSLARADRTVYLVERSPIIGGKAALYDEVFPSMECGSCILQPMMDSILHNDHVTLFTCSTLEQVLGYFGNFHVTIRQRPRYVDPELCIGCEACFATCPVEIPNEYDQFLSKRHAIYVPYSGALPNVAIIDSEHCLRHQGEDCQACSDACPFNAIRYHDKDKLINLKVGAIIVATGFDLPGDVPDIPDVFTGLAFERMLNPMGPTQGRLFTTSGSAPRHVIIIHCIDPKGDNLYPCSSEIHSMVALKQADIIEKRWPSIDVTHLYTEMCIQGRPAQGLFHHIRNSDRQTLIRIDPCNTLQINSRGHLLDISFMDFRGRPRSVAGDMVIINPLLRAAGMKQMASILDLDLDEDGSYQETDPLISPLYASRRGIWFAGCVRAAKDIAGSIIEGKAAAGEVLSSLIPGKTLTLEPEAVYLMEELCSNCGICVSTCYYKALDRDKDTGKISLERLLCRGCGSCVAACPSGALEAPCYTDLQLREQLHGLFDSSRPSQENSIS